MCYDFFRRTYFNLALDGFRRPRCFSLTAEMYQTAGIIFNVAFGQNLFGAPQNMGYVIKKLDISIIWYYFCMELIDITFVNKIDYSAPGAAHLLLKLVSR